MPDSDPRVTELEIALAHQERAAEELSDVVREQAARLDALERRVDRLVTRLAGLEEASAAPPAADVRPPHW
jgi:SlyX protein